MTVREYDIVVYGATGYTGQLVAQYLTRRITQAFYAKRSIKLAIAGRDIKKLESLKQSLVALDRANEDIAIEIADANDESALMALAGKTQVLITTVGPFLQFGEPVLKACAEQGTDYLDLTGEFEFVDRMYPKYDTVARATKARLIHCCGFDSIPADLGVLYCMQQLSEQVGGLDNQAVIVNGYVQMGGRISGGTWHSIINALSRVRYNLSVKNLWQSITSGKIVDGRRIKMMRPKLRFDRKLKSWLVPLPTIDSQVVRRSAELFEQYGRDFTYGHHLQIKKLPKFLIALGGASAIFGLSQIPWTKTKLMELMESGEGPTDGDRERAWFKLLISAKTVSLGSGTHEVRISVRGGDPGYSETAKMISEAALTLIDQREHLEPVYGVLTPAAALGDHLIDRLMDTGIQFRLLD